MQKSYVKIWQFQNKDVTLQHQTNNNKQKSDYVKFSIRSYDTVIRW